MPQEMKYQTLDPVTLNHVFTLAYVLIAEQAAKMKHIRNRHQRKLQQRHIEGMKMLIDELEFKYFSPYH